MVTDITALFISEESIICVYIDFIVMISYLTVLTCVYADFSGLIFV